MNRKGLKPVPCQHFLQQVSVITVNRGVRAVPTIFTVQASAAKITFRDKHRLRKFGIIAAPDDLELDRTFLRRLSGAGDQPFSERFYS